MKRQRVARALVTVALVAPVLTGCAMVPGMGCYSPNDAVVDELMSHAKTDFMSGDSKIGGLKFNEGAQGPLPEALRRYGAIDVVVINALSYFGNPASEELGGVYGDNTFVVDEDGHPSGAVGWGARTHFDLPVPDEPGWEKWAERVDDSSVELELSQCVG